MQIGKYNISRRFWVAAIAATAVVFFLIAIWNVFPIRAEILIPGVPYEGVYTYGLETGTAAAALSSVFGYWSGLGSPLPAPTMRELDREFPHNPFDFPVPSALLQYAKNLGYEAEIVRISNPKKLAALLMRERVPLIFLQRPTPEYPGRYAPYRVLIGASTTERRFVVHDVYFGPAYPVTFDDFREDFSRVPENLTSVFLVIRPPDSKALLAPHITDAASYPDRGEYDRFVGVMLEWFTATNVDLPWGRPKIAVFEKILSDPVFDDLHPAVRLYVFGELSRHYRYIGDIEKALKYAEEAEVLNSNLARPFGVWTGFRANEIARPWVRLGEVYAQTERKEAAIQAFRTALRLEPNNVFDGPIARSGLETLQGL